MQANKNKCKYKELLHFIISIIQVAWRELKRCGKSLLPDHVYNDYRCDYIPGKCIIYRVLHAGKSKVTSDKVMYRGTREKKFKMEENFTCFSSLSTHYKMTKFPWRLSHNCIQRGLAVYMVYSVLLWKLIYLKIYTSMFFSSFLTQVTSNCRSPVIARVVIAIILKISAKIWTSATQIFKGFLRCKSMGKNIENSFSYNHSYTEKLFLQPVPGMANPYEKPQKRCMICEHNITLDYKVCMGHWEIRYSETWGTLLPEKPFCQKMCPLKIGELWWQGHLYYYTVFVPENNGLWRHVYPFSG